MLQHYSEDEAFALIMGIVVAGISWISWYYGLAVVGTRVRPHSHRWPLMFAPPACAFLLYFVLKRWSAEDVRRDPAYMLFYMVLGLAWLGLFKIQLPFFGLSARDDVLERGNPAAAWACAGALLGATCCFAGANVGNGPGWWVVLFSGLLSTASFLGLWWVLHLCSGLSEKITIDLDSTAGLRSVGFFIGTGLILGRAVAGDWLSAADTTVDFVRMAWPALVLTGMAIAAERLSPPRLVKDAVASIFSGLLPAFIYVLIGLAAMLAYST